MRVANKRLYVCLCLCLYLCLCLCFFIASPAVADESISLFDEGHRQHVASFSYGGRSEVAGIPLVQKKTDSILQIRLDDRTSAGAEIGFTGDTSVDLSDIRTTGAITFRVKGAIGGETVYIGLKDNGDSGTAKVQVKCKSENYVSVMQEWNTALIPLTAFADAGERWREDLQTSEYGAIDWKNITSIVFSTRKGHNTGRSRDRIATLFLDDIKIVADPDTMPTPEMVPWRMRTETVSAPSPDTSGSEKILFSWIDDRIARYTSVYTYGDPTDFRLLHHASPDTPAVLAAYLSDNEWSGVTLYRGSSVAIDISPYLKTGGVEFMVRGAHGGEVFAIGLLDDDSDGADKKVQSSVESRNYVSVSKQWQKVKVPFSDFNDIGRWWDSEANQNVMRTIDWSSIAEIRFSTNKGSNRDARIDNNGPVTLYFSDIRFTKDSDVFNRELYWKTFSSDASDKLIADFENEESIKGWEASIDTTSTMSIAAGVNAGDSSRAISIDYTIGAWGSASATTDSAHRDWSQHRGISFDFFSARPIEKFTILIRDESNEAWSAFFEAKNGWQSIILPFSQFELYEYWQPEDAQMNRRMDLGRVKSYDFRPAHPGSRGTMMLDNIRLTNRSGLPVVSSIRANQLGYYVGRVKRFVVTDSAAKTFSIADKGGKEVFSGTIDKGRVWDLAGEYAATGDFTKLDTPGAYRVVIGETGEEAEIVIGENIYGKVYEASIKAFFYQRSWADLKPQHAGKWHRSKGTPDTACIFHASAGREGVLDVSGGWYDAGDYGKYIVNGGISVGTMLALYELFPDRMSDSVNIPQSGNNIADILDEVRYELDWMKKMQDRDGGVFFKVGPLKWDGYVMPSECDSKRFVIGKSTTSSLNFAAVMGMAARVYASVDSSFSKDCIKRAEKAWQWAQDNPEIREPAEQGGSGAYADSKFEDEFFWAASELYTTTKKEAYKAFVENSRQITPMTTAANWQNVHNLGWFTLATHFSAEENQISQSARRQITELADRFLAQMDSIPYRIPSNSFMWGSNSEQLNHAIVLAYAHHFTAEERYLDAAIETCDYIFGKNAVGYSFVTGYGSRSSKWPHHRVMAADGIDAPIPGFVVGGPNNGMQDTQDPSIHYHHTEPARAYLDKVASYASNEIAINWNAALVFMLGYLQMQ